MTSMKTYGQFCPVSKSLDVIGDRWSLLIVRELLLRGACRYTDLRAGLPGIATNLLADRLRELEKAGVVVSRLAPPPVATTLFTLTERGADLEGVILALGRWGIPLLHDSEGDDDGETFQGHWLGIPVRMHMADQSPDQPPVTVAFQTGNGTVYVEASGGELKTSENPPLEPPAAEVAGSTIVVIALITGRIGLSEAIDRGLVCTGDRRAVERLLPQEAAAPAGGA